MEPKDRIAWERVKQTSASPTVPDIHVNTLTDINTNILSMDGTHRPALSPPTAWRPQQLLNRSNGSVTFTAKVLQNHDDGDEEEEKEHETHPQVSVTSWEESSGNSGVCRSASDPELQPPIVQELSSSPVIVPRWERRKLPPSPGLVVRHRTPPPVAPKPTFLLPTRSPPAWGHTVSQDPGVALRPSGLQRGGGSPIPLPRKRVLSLGCVVDECPGFHLGRGKEPYAPAGDKSSVSPKRERMLPRIPPPNPNPSSNPNPNPPTPPSKPVKATKLHPALEEDRKMEGTTRNAERQSVAAIDQRDHGEVTETSGALEGSEVGVQLLPKPPSRNKPCPQAAPRLVYKDKDQDQVLMEARGSPGDAHSGLHAALLAPQMAQGASRMPAEHRKVLPIDWNQSARTLSTSEIPLEEPDVCSTVLRGEDESSRVPGKTGDVVPLEEHSYSTQGFKCSVPLKTTREEMDGLWVMVAGMETIREGRREKKISQEYKRQREAEAEIPVTILQLHSQQPIRRPSQVTLIEEKERDEEDGEKEERTGVTVRGLMEEERDEENAEKEERNSVTAESPMPLRPNLFEMKERQEESFNSLFNSRRLANSEMNLVNEILSGPEWSKYLVNQSDTEDTDIPNSKNNRLEMFSFTNDQACDNHYNDDDIYEYIATPDTSMQPQQQSEGEIEVKHQGTNQYPERAVREISKPSMHDSGHMSLRTKDTYDTVELFDFSAIKSEPVLDSSAQKDRIRLSKKRKHKKPKFKFRFHGKTTDVKDTGDHSDFSAIKSEAILDSSAQKHRINLSNKRKHQKPKIKFRGHDAGIFSLTKAPLRSSSPPIPSVFYSIPPFIPEEETSYAKPVHRAGGSSPMTKIMTALKGGRRPKEDRNKSKD